MKWQSRATLMWGALTCGLLLCNPASLAQTVYRCGDSYSQVPCAGGRTLDASDPRSAEDKRRADSATREGLAAANRMEHERLLAEASRPAAYTLRPAPLGQHAAVAPEKAPPKHSRKKTSKKLPPDYFTAAGPGATKPPKTAKAAKPQAE